MKGAGKGLKRVEKGSLPVQRAVEDLRGDMGFIA